MEYIILFIEFFKTKKIAFIFWILMIPIMVGFITYFLSYQSYFITNGKSLQGSIVTVVGVLVGFSISMFTILLTSSNQNLDAAKEYKTNFKLNNSKVTLYQLLIINLGYIVIVEGFLLIANLLYPLLIDSTSKCWKIIFSVNMAILIHVIITTLRTILDFYFIISKNND